MRKLFVPLILGSTLALGACATSPYGSQYGSYGSQYGSYGSQYGYGSPYGSYGNSGGLSAVLGAVLGSSGSGYYGGGSSFQQAAVNACASTAARYGGQVAIRDVRQSSRSTLRVYGVVSTRYDSRNFACSFRSDGRITDFDL